MPQHSGHYYWRDPIWEHHRYGIVSATMEMNLMVERSPKRLSFGQFEPLCPPHRCGINPPNIDTRPHMWGRPFPVKANLPGYLCAIFGF
jgi:hypothetical protein